MIRIILISLCFILFTINTQAQSPFEIQAISPGIEKKIDGVAMVQFEIHSKVNSFEFRLAWTNKHVSSLKGNIPSDLTYSEPYTLNQSEFLLIERTFTEEELLQPKTLVVQALSGGAEYLIPIPYAFTISEVDVDTPGSDSEEFIELIAPGFAFGSLNGLEVWAVNGNNDDISKRFELDEPDFISNVYGLFLIAGRDLSIPEQMQLHTMNSSTNLFQNGNSSYSEADAVALVWSIEDIDQHIIMDALIYDVGREAEDEGLGEFLGMNSRAAVEGRNASKDDVSLHRVVSAWGPLKNADAFMEAEPSPGIARYVQIEGNLSENKWVMMGAPTSLALNKWLEPSLYTQGALGADIEEGDPITFRWSNQQFSPVMNLNERLNELEGIFLYVTESTFNYGIDGWPKPLGIEANFSAFRSFNDYSTEVSTLGDGLNLLSNPYPFFIDLNQLLVENPSVQSISVWNGETKQYEVWDGQAGDLAPSLIPPFGGFWAKVLSNEPIQIRPSTIAFNQVQKQRVDQPLNQIALLLESGSIQQRVLFKLDQLDNSATQHQNSIEFKSWQADQPLSMYLKLDALDESSYKLLNVDENYLASNSLSLVIHNLITDPNLKLSIDAKFTDLQLIQSQFFLEQNGQKRLLTVDHPLDLKMEGKACFVLNWNNLNSTNVFEEPNIHDYSMDYRLIKNYPNPFNPSTTLQYELKQPAVVEFQLFDTQGKLIRTIFRGSQSAGIYRKTLNMDSNLQSGLYIIRMLVNGNHVDQHKLLFLK